MKEIENRVKDKITNELAYKAHVYFDKYLQGLIIKYNYLILFVQSLENFILRFGERGLEGILANLHFKANDESVQLQTLARDGTTTLESFLVWRNRKAI